MITGSVGTGARNERDDVRTVQALLNLSLDRLPGIEPLKVDGLIGSKTITAIEVMQREVVGMTRPDGVAHPDGGTLRRLMERIVPGFTDANLQLAMPNALAANVARYRPPLQAGMAAHGIDTPLRQAHFLAQLAHESAEFTYTEELASGAAYEGRADLGNSEPGDGVRFKGRGLIQLTGRANYRDFGAAIGEDLLSGDNPRRVAADPRLAVEAACWFWRDKGLNALADRDDVRKVTKRINGGYNGLEHRMACLLRSRAVLGVEAHTDL